MKFIVNGACGRMGHEVIKQLSEDELAARVDAFSEEDGVIRDINEYNGRADGIIDFSSHLGSAALCRYASEHKTPLVIASTGHTDEEKHKIEETSQKIPVFFSYNMSIGIGCAV